MKDFRACKLTFNDKKYHVNAQRIVAEVTPDTLLGDGNVNYRFCDCSESDAVLAEVKRIRANRARRERDDVMRSCGLVKVSGSVSGRNTPGPWRYEPETKTIRAVPSNYWLATMDSFDGAVDHVANARLIAAAPELLEALRRSLLEIDNACNRDERINQDRSIGTAIRIMQSAIAKAVKP